MRLPMRSWKNTLQSLGMRIVAPPNSRARHRAPFRPQLESLEARQLLAADLQITEFKTDDTNWVVKYDVTTDAVTPFDISVYRSSDGVTRNALLNTQRITDPAKLTLTDQPGGQPHSVTVTPNFTDVQQD